MKIDTVKVNYGKTINLGNYESARIDIELSATIEDNDNPQETAEQLRQQAKLMCLRWAKNEQRNGAEEYF